MKTRKYYNPRDGATPTRAFTTDGCSGGMSWAWQTFVKPLTKTDIPWRQCCVVHDRAYWMGGTWTDRRVADKHSHNSPESNTPSPPFVFNLQLLQLNTPDSKEDE